MMPNNIPNTLLPWVVSLIFANRGDKYQGPVEQFVNYSMIVIIGSTSSISCFPLQGGGGYLHWKF